MKVLHVSKLFPPFFGGIETVAYDTVVELKESGFDVDVLCVANHNKSSTELVDGVKVFRCSSFAHLASTYLSISFLFRWLKIKNDYDIIHVHLPNPLAMIALFLFRTKAKVVLHWHSDIVKQRFLKIPFLPLQRWLLNKCNYIITTSPNYATHSSDLSLFLDKVRVVPIGISTETLYVDESFMGQLRAMYYGKKIVFSLGRHIYYKGFEFLIDAAQLLPDDYVVLIGGEGELTNELKKKINQYNLTNKIKLLGRIPLNHLGSYYNICDVFCLPSIERSEAFGVVQLEAMSFGKPVVSTSIEGSGVPWVNQHNKTGVVVPVRDPGALAEGIIKASTIGLSQSVNIKKYFNTNFCRQKMAKCIIDLYKNTY